MSTKDEKKTDSAKTAKRCPACQATVFQGPFQRGPIVDGMMTVRETLYQCVNCHAVRPLEQFEDYPLP